MNEFIFALAFIGGVALSGLFVLAVTMAVEKVEQLDVLSARLDKLEFENLKKRGTK